MDKKTRAIFMSLRQALIMFLRDLERELQVNKSVTNKEERELLTRIRDERRDRHHD